MNVIICLRDIAENPVTRDGKKTTPITYDSNCLEEICGSCAMLINGKARMACSALVDPLEQPIRIEPMSKFPLAKARAYRPKFRKKATRFRIASLAATAWKFARR